MRHHERRAGPPQASERPLGGQRTSRSGERGGTMIATLLFVAFVVMMLIGVPIGAALGLAGAACIALANADAAPGGEAVTLKKRKDKKEEAAEAAAETEAAEATEAEAEAPAE